MQVGILMATYNGSLFLEEQIQSIRKQTFLDWQLFVRDDFSSDSTVEILKKYADIDPRISLYLSQMNVGAKNSFNQLLKSALDFQYIMFCDQDDVWFDNKIEITLKKMVSIESKFGKNFPLLVFTDLTAVNKKLEMLSPSYNEFLNLKIKSNFLPSLIAQPYIFGCTTMINQKLARDSFPIPKGAEMHDCWISLTAALIGAIEYIPESTIFHRYHGENASGENFEKHFFLRIKKFLRKWEGYINNTHLRLNQCQLLLDRFIGYKSSQRYQELFFYNKKIRKGKIRAILASLQYGVFRQGFIQTILFFLSIFGGPEFCQNSDRNKEN